MSDTLLYRAAFVWDSISHYKYSFTYGFKMKLYTINLSFSAEDFPHLAGLQYLKDLVLPRFTPAKTIKKILDGTITQEQIEKGLQYEEMVKPRLLALVSLEEMLDREFTLYSYMPRFYPFVTSIQADYLITSHTGNISFIFLIREGKKNIISDCICCSIFIKGKRNYEQNQRPYTLLKKTKTKLSDGTTNTLFIKNGFVDPDSLDENNPAE